MKTVVFCDDQSGFWLNRSEWQDWPDWRILSVANPEFEGDVVADMKREINNLGIQGPFYVVTDANFGAGLHLGGAKLLAELFELKQIHRGVVYSPEPESGQLLDRQIAAGLACAVENDQRSDLEKTEVIRAFLETGKAPAPSTNTQIHVLSKAIHRLENLALPLRLDLETLDARRSEAEVVDAIWEDYFSLPSDGGGFLLPTRTFTEGTLGIEKEIIRTLDSVRSVPKVIEGKRWKALDSGKGFAPKTVSKELGIDAARKNANSFKGKSKDLEMTLTQVLDRIIKLANELRELRNQLEAPEEGAQP